MNKQNLLPDAENLYGTLLEQIKTVTKDLSKFAIVGIHSGGAWIAERLAKDLGIKDIGFIDTSFYRDDYSERGLPSNVKPSQINFEVTGATILLVDDVLYTGRTTRAAINELFDYGRPDKILLAALVDRGGRELPIAANFVAHEISVKSNQTVVLQKGNDGSFSITVKND